MAKPFVYIYQYFSKNRLIFFAVLIAFFLIPGYFASRIRPEEDISKILPRDRQTEKLSEILQNARFADKLVLMVSLKDSNQSDPATLAAFADSFAEKLQQQYPGYVREVESRINDSLFPRLIQILQDHLPVFLDEDDYRAMDTLVNSGVLRNTLMQDRHTLVSPAGMVMKFLIARDPVGISSLALKKLRQIQYDENFDLYEGHVLTRDGKTLMVFISPVFPPDNTGKNEVLLNGIDGIIDNLQSAAFPVAQADYFGAVAVSEGNARQLRKDSFLTLGLTLSFLIIFISWYFKRKRAPIVILLPVVFGALFSLALIYLIKGSISVIALAAGSVVLGIAINYSLHVYNHFRHSGDMRTVIEDLAFPLTIGGLTTIGGFLALQFVRSDMLKDLGLFAAFSLIGASLGSLIFLPQLIAPIRKTNAGVETEKEKSWIARLAALHPEKNRYLVAIILALTVVFSFTMGKVSFDQDMMHMNFMSDRLKKTEARLNRINEYSLRSVYMVTEGKDFDDALQNQEALNNKIDSLQQKNIIRKTSGAFRLMVSNELQQQRIAEWERYWTRSKKDSLLQALQRTGDSLGFSANAFIPFSALLNKKYEPLDSNARAIMVSAVAANYILSKPGKTSLVTLLKVADSDRAAVYHSFSNEPKATVIDRQYFASKLANIVSADFSQIGWMTSILVFLVLLITYGRIELTLASFIPMFIAFIWILGIMGMAGLQFNIVNIILSALIFGLGDDYSLFIMDGLLQEYRTGKKNLPSYKSSIVLSAITTLAGLGVLIFARHPALRSIALISITGILSVVFISQILIPWIFNLLITNRVRNGRFPWTASSLVKSVFSLSYFAIGSWIVTACGIVLTANGKTKNEKLKRIYHAILSFYTWSVLYIMGNVKKKLINPQQETFYKPAVIIANHQSFLDILVVTLIYPPVILLTNEWVWNSPLFGKLVRLADYYPVAEGVEQGMPLFEDRVKAGYSIVVFPEGTRSTDDRIKRFHKGAFFIAEKLGLDLLPLLIHGTSYTMSKSDFMLKDGYVTMKLLPRIQATDLSFGANYTERAKRVGRYFREQYECLKRSSEQPFYFREQLIRNYLYKGPVLEWYAKFKTRSERNYQPIHDLLPEKGLILDLGCGYGFMSYMLHFVSPERKIIGYDYDEDKVAVANHCFSRDEYIHFEQADVSKLEPQPAVGIILSDVLHYLKPEQQIALLERAIVNLEPNGVLLIREGDRDLEKRHKGTRFSEFLSTRFFTFNKTAGRLHFMSGNTIRELAARRNMSCRMVDDSKYTSNLIFVITHPGSNEKI